MRALVLFSLLLAVATPVAARSGPLDPPRPAASRAADPALLCETAITSAEYVGRLPPRLLGAIGLTESGRADPGSGRVRPWPWTINAEGEGQFFQTRQQAVAAVRALQARGVRSIDVGCLQVNLMYHPDAFATLEDAFDPPVNAAYAARFLNALYVEGRNWAHAIAAYHSQTPALGDAYRVLVMARWQNGDLRAAAAAVVTAYGDFVRRDVAYGAFAPSTRVYGAFAMPASGR
jgi:Transglycosylase SLT domain